MLEKIENFLRDLISSLQSAKLYTTEHPRFQKFLDKAYDSLQDALRDKEELIIGIIQEELAFEKEILFDLSKITRPVIIYLKERGIEKIAFYRGIDKEELSKFIAFLAAPKEELKVDAQKYLVLKGIKNITVGKIKVSALPSQSQLEEAVNYLSLYESLSDKSFQVQEAVLSGEAIDYLALRFSLTNIMENLVSRYQELLNLVTVKRYDLGTFIHSLNVCVLAMHFSSKIGFAKDDVLDIGIAALFHDIGKLYISRKIIKKPDKVTEEEFAKIKSHVTQGAEILLKYVNTLGILPVAVCFEHHLKYNLEGYPKLNFPYQPHIASLIVSICDVYDALSLRRSYKNDYPPNMIYDLMIKEKGNSFEPQLLDKFFAIMGVWPIGTIVALNDERIAVIRDENRDDISSPKVEVIYPADKKETIDLKERKQDIKIKCSLNPWKEGKDYLRLV